MATIGGNLCNAAPSADTAPPLIGLGATAKIEGSKGERFIALEDFFTGPRKTVLDQGELLTAILIPEPSHSSGSAFRKIARVTLSLAKINCAVYVEREGDVCTHVRAALGGVAPKPVRAFSFEQAMTGKELTPGSLARAAEMVKEDISPRNARSTAAYKRHAASYLIQDTLEVAWKRSGGEMEK